MNFYRNVGGIVAREGTRLVDRWSGTEYIEWLAKKYDVILPSWWDPLRGTMLITATTIYLSHPLHAPVRLNTETSKWEILLKYSKRIKIKKVKKKK